MTGLIMMVSWVIFIRFHAKMQMISKIAKGFHGYIACINSKLGKDVFFNILKPIFAFH